MPALLDSNMTAKKRQGGPGRAPEPSPERRPGGRTPPAEIRYGSRTKAELQQYRDQIAGLLAEYDAALALMDELGLDELRLDGVTKGERGIETWGGFVANVHSAVHKQRLRRF